MEYVILLCMIAIIFIFLAITGAVNSYKRKKYLIKVFAESYGGLPKRVYKDGEFEHICGYYKNHASENYIDDITWNDLNLDELYARINYCQSSAGEEYLYYLLRNPGTTSSNIEIDRIATLFDSDEEARVRVAYALYECGKTGKYSIYDYINNLDILDGTNAKSDIILLVVELVAIVCCFVNLSWGLIILIPILLFGSFTYFKKKRKIEPYITCFSYVFRVINGTNGILKATSNLVDEYRIQLLELSGRMSGFKRFSRIVMNQNTGSGDLAEMILDYIRMFFHLDIIKFYNMLDELKKHRDDIDSMLTIIGKLDTSISLAYYRKSITDWCVPHFEGEKMIAKNLYHPLLKNPVANDISISNGMLLTGSNASGKSTFLKTVAINSILAQSINTVCASSYSAPFYRVYTSLALSDNIFEGESYYMTEIRSLKRIIDSGRTDNTRILACVDEVLRGTNTVERIAASSVILKNLSKINGMILTATHDLELSYMLEDIYDNYHFEETIHENDISFSYKIMDGRTTTRNAIKLLDIMGYDKDIINDAMEAVATYEKTGAFV